ncbi:c-type cytochrome domain-containing protein [Lignipirellula cremea]|uniref:Planctomycete cytochrome C n=1 Tax=Lignipirellula cremea TaxID=2528010 RepID=A0A518DPR7_9BACT|nr:c-type cytochrome domain-containing protein [Lignipirellula cremea]QDU93837.1 Planctomycete cytochrome C [Lignipirellula cremea]
MMRVTRRFLRIRQAALAAILLLIYLPTIAAAAPSAAQRKQAYDLLARIQAAGQQYAQGKFAESAAGIQAVQSDYETLAATADRGMVEALNPVYDSLSKAHRLLSSKAKFSPLSRPTIASTPKPSTTPAPKPEPASPTPATGVSFVKDVAPMLVAKCGRCHVSKTTGGFSMATFADLMRGTADGVVVTAGSDASLLIETIASGDMPRGGAKVTPAELAALTKWIVEGAKFDGPDQSVSLATFGTAMAGGRMAAPEVRRATGKETVSFVNDIAGILVANCNNCHIGAQRASGGLNLGTFATMLRGGDSGSPITPNDPAGSLLVQKLKGMGGGQQMPLRKSPLPPEQIALIEKWISEGATYDAEDPRADVIKLAARSHAENSTHEELAAERADQAVKYWNVSMSGIDANKVDTEHFLILGNQSEENLAKLEEVAKKVTPQLVEMFGAPADQPLVKGKTTVFVFKQRYDYSEFGNMVEKRSIPQELRGHWRYDVVDAYAALIPPRRDEYSIDALIGQQIAGVYISSLNDPPRWFAEGAARYAASKINPEDTRVSEWNERIPEVKSSVAKASDFLQGKMPAENSDIMAYGVVKFLMSDAGRFRKLLGSLRTGTDFDPAFQTAYGGTPEQVVTMWMKQNGR